MIVTTFRPKSDGRLHEPDSIAITCEPPDERHAQATLIQ
jgi:hypothetical protein